ncbi:hypothetical protein Lal_00000919 [Lupinus albus]|nr:hypothetical protein Lal_00000919 [Lupinus albus]
MKFLLSLTITLRKKFHVQFSSMLPIILRIRITMRIKIRISIATTIRTPKRSNMPLIMVLYEINMVGGSYGRWVDIGVSHHVCYDRVMFKTYTNAYDKKVLLGDSQINIVADIGDVELKFTYKKILIHKDIMHTLDIGRI